jgi:hypothetical protein
MNAAAVPCPATTRSTIPNTTVLSHTAIPAGRSASGRRQARDKSQPAASPQRNGHDVEATPPSVSPLSWLARPMTTKTSTQQTSSSTASLAERMQVRLAADIHHRSDRPPGTTDADANPQSAAPFRIKVFLKR